MIQWFRLFAGCVAKTKTVMKYVKLHIIGLHFVCGACYNKTTIVNR